MCIMQMPFSYLLAFSSKNPIVPSLPMWKFAMHAKLTSNPCMVHGVRGKHSSDQTNLANTLKLKTPCRQFSSRHINKRKTFGRSRADRTGNTDLTPVNVANFWIFLSSLSLFFWNSWETTTLMSTPKSTPSILFCRFPLDCSYLYHLLSIDTVLRHLESETNHEVLAM